jgi:RNAse (barnase) inhibitor barstar
MKPEHLRKLLAQAELCGIYHLPSSGVAPLQEAAESLDYACFKADLRESGDIAIALAELGRSLGFPEWYGANLDALNDCLTDFSWHEASGYVVIIAGADTLHSLGEPFSQINQVLGNAIQEWRKQGIPFWVFYDMRADGLAALPTLA